MSLICTYADLRRYGKLAEIADFKDDPSLPDEEEWRRVISYAADWEPLAAFPCEIAERLGLNRSTRSPKTGGSKGSNFSS